MGSTSADPSDDGQPVTGVRISGGFWCGKHEVTQDQWQEVTGATPYTHSRFRNAGCGRCPVTRVSCDDAQACAERLNARVGRSRYRLPKEAVGVCGAVGAGRGPIREPGRGRLVHGSQRGSHAASARYAAVGAESAERVGPARHAGAGGVAPQLFESPSVRPADHVGSLAVQASSLSDTSCTKGRYGRWRVLRSATSTMT